ncbi:MAG: ATP-binding cassette domain-containing protein [Candidatus Hydrogenedentales bacterium]
MSITESDRNQSAHASICVAESVLSAHDVTIRIGNTPILDGLTLDVRRGEHVAMLGHNGAGKTSMLRAILGLFRRSGGSVALFGSAAKGRSLDVLSRTGALLGTPAFYENMTVSDHLRLAAKLRCARADVNSAIDEGLQLLELVEHRYKRLMHCSSGMRKRVAMACAFMGNPELLLLDDPTAELDAAGIDRLRDMIRRFREHNGKASLVLATHSLSLARDLGDRVMVVDHGKEVFDGSWQAFDTTIGGLYEVTVANDDGLPADALRNEPYVLDFKPRGGNVYLVCVRDAAIGRFVAALVRSGMEVVAVVPVPFTSDDFVKRVEAVEGTVAPQAPSPKETSRERANRPEAARKRIPSLGRRIATSLVWETKVLYRSATLWIIPFTLAVCAALGITGAIPAQEKLLAQQVTMSFLVTSTLALLALLGSIVMAIAAGIAICTDYAQNRLRFLFVLPLRNRDMLLSKVFVWNVLLPVYVIGCVVGISLASCFVAQYIGDYPWSEEGFGLPPWPMTRELLRYLPGVFIAYVGIGLLSSAMGVLFRRTQVVLTATVLILVLSYLAMPGFQLHLLPFSDIIVETNMALLPLGSGVVPLEAPMFTHSMGAAGVWIAILYAVAAAVFSRKKW